MPNSRRVMICGCDGLCRRRQASLVPVNDDRHHVPPRCRDLRDREQRLGEDARGEARDQNGDGEACDDLLGTGHLGVDHGSAASFQGPSLRCRSILRDRQSRVTVHACLKLNRVDEAPFSSPHAQQMAKPRPFHEGALAGRSVPAQGRACFLSKLMKSSPSS